MHVRTIGAASAHLFCSFSPLSKSIHPRRGFTSPAPSPPQPLPVFPPPRIRGPREEGGGRGGGAVGVGPGYGEGVAGEASQPMDPLHHIQGDPKVECGATMMKNAVVQSRWSKHHEVAKNMPRSVKRKMSHCYVASVSSRRRQTVGIGITQAPTVKRCGSFALIVGADSGVSLRCTRQKLANDKN